MIDAGVGAPTYLRAPLLPRLPSLERIKSRIGAKLVRWGLDLQPEGNLVSHARQELEIAGWFEPDVFYGEMMGQAVIDLQKLFAMEGHSGMSAGLATSLFEKTSRFEPLTPLTGEDSEWTDVADGVFQNKRCSHVFKENGEAYDINGRIFRDSDGACFTNGKSRVPVNFPYTPTSEYVDVPADEDGRA